MQSPDNYKNAFKAWREGFALGVFTGLVSWLFMGKPIYTLPLVLGLAFGSIAFHLKFNKENQNNTL